jgi:hypothetical protein
MIKAHRPPAPGMMCYHMQAVLGQPAERTGVRICTCSGQNNFGEIIMVRIDLITRLRAFEARKPATKTPDDWRERLARYKR